MSAWCDHDQHYDRAEAYGQHVSDDAFYECSLEDLCATIDDASASFFALADEFAELTTTLLHVGPRRSMSGSSPGAGAHPFEDAA